MAKRTRADVTAQPHDAIIKYTFSQREHAAGLLQAALAPEIAALVRWATLRLEKIHFVDRGLRGRYADLLFSAEMGAERMYFYVLLEHQSRVEKLMIFRMGAYMWRQWESLVRDEPTRESLPVIIPVLIHHSATGWTAATAFEDLMAIPEASRAAVQRYVPHFQMKLVDVSRDPSGGLVKKALTDLGRVVLWCLSVAGDRKRVQTEIGALGAELNALYTARERDALVAVLRYLVATHPELSVASVGDLLETTARKGRAEVDMDRLDRYMEERKREGMAEVLLELLAARFGAVPAKANARIRAARAPSLKRWSLRVLTAPTLDAVLEADTPPAPAKNAKKRVTPKRRPAARKRARPAK